MRIRALCLMGAVFLFVTAGAVEAQQGTVTGTVTNVETGAVLVNAVVQVTTGDGGRIGSSLTNQSGRYLIAGVPPGSYQVVVTMTGFATGEFDVQVGEGQTATVNAALAMRVIDHDPVVVSASRHEERAIDTPVRTEVVTPQLIEELPAIQPTEHLRSIAGVDIVTQGLQSTNVVARGFNNIFSGALLALTDHRIAAVPSLRVNTLYMVPANNEDLERMEVVLGPGSALYGPNTANGVLHMFTRSPLTYQGTTATVTGGDRSVFQGTFRTAHLVSENVGVKVSGQYFQGDEWEFTDSVEVVAHEAARLTDPNTRIGVRDFDTRRWAVDGRIDWRVTEDATAIFSAGRSITAEGIELTGLGAGQVKDWAYDYFQGRFNWGRLFAQAYLNTSDAGETYLLREGTDIVDTSKMFVAQVQHGLEPFRWQNLTYGFDYLLTMPETGRTIHGRFEDDDEYTEIGGFLQSETALTPKLDLVLAGRLDRHSVVDELVFSPRAALVFKPAETQTLRASYNRAYSNPGSIHLFLDLGAGPVPGPAGQFGYALHVQATGREGFQFRQDDGSFLMRSPFGGDARALQTVNTGNLWAMQVNAIAGALVRQGSFTQQQAQLFVAFMRAQTPGEAQVGLAGINPVTRELGAFVGPEDVPGIRESTNTGYEVGYTGLFGGGRFRLAADVWYSQRENFISPLIPQTPFALLNPQQLVPYAAPRIQQFLMAGGMPPAQAEATAAVIAGNMAQIPGGVVSSADIGGEGADLLVTYRNFGDIDLWGTDLSASALFGDWSVGLSTSLVSDDHFRTEGEIVTLNAPKEKGTFTVGYRNEGVGFNGEARLRHMGGFPVNSGVFIGIRCLEPDSETENCVESHTLTDLTLGYRVPGVRGASLQLAVQNLFDTDYQSFIGVPEIGRMALLRLRYDF